MRKESETSYLSRSFAWLLLPNPVTLGSFLQPSPVLAILFARFTSEVPGLPERRPNGVILQAPRFISRSWTGVFLERQVWAHMTITSRLPFPSLLLAIVWPRGLASAGTHQCRSLTCFRMPRGRGYPLCRGRLTGAWGLVGP